MRLSSSFFRANTAAPRGDLTGPPGGEAGADGDTLLSDLAAGGPDINPELSGWAKFPVYDEMRRSDPTAKSIVWVPTLTIRSAKWGCEPRDETPLARVIRDACAWQFGLEDEPGYLAQSWSRLTAQGLEQMYWGAMLEEIVWADPTRLFEWRDADGDPHPLRPILRVAPRRPRTIAKVERGPDGTIARVTQNIAGTEPIPGSKLTYMVFEEEGGAWDGVSMLRPAWLAWRVKKSLLISAGIGWDRFALGLPVVWHPDNPDAEDTARQIGRNIRSHERAYVHFPTVGPSDTGNPDTGWGLEIMNAAASLADPSPLIRLCSQMEAEAGLQLFMRQGQDQTGARAAAETQADPFYLACEALADEYRRDRTRQLFRRFVEVNFGAQAAETATPRLTVSRILPRNLDAISHALSYLSAAGFTFTDRGAEDDVRELLGFPRLPNDLDQQGVPRAQLLSILQGLGLDPATLAEIVNALPADVGVARNRVPPEGSSPITG